MTDTLSQGEVKNRKEQRCFGCGNNFSAGTKLEKITTADSGIITTTYWCDTCRIYWTEHMRWDDLIMAGELRDNDKEEWERIYRLEHHTLKNRSAKNLNNPKPG
jgi:hypothetical protein